MADSRVNVTFLVKSKDIFKDSAIFIIGNCVELGLWKPKLARPLTLKYKATEKSSEQVWIGSFNLNASEICYRFFIGSTQLVMKDGVTEEVVLINRWEASTNQRKLVLTTAVTVETTFGHFEGESFLEEGWLTGQTEVHLSLHSHPFKFWNSLFHSSDNHYVLNCLSFDVRSSSSLTMDDSISVDKNENRSYIENSKLMSSVLVSVLNGNDDRPRLLPPGAGIPFNPNEFVTLKVQTCCFEYLAFKIIINVVENDVDLSLRELGVAFISSLDLNCKRKTITTPLISSKRFEPIGMLQVDVLVMTSLNYDWDMSYNHQSFMNPNKTDFVGHRGMGKSCFIDKPNPIVTENTILSLIEAEKVGADMVEFDVMLTSDRIPVLHHDFITNVMIKVTQKEDKLIKIPVHYLNLKELEAVAYASASDALLTKTDKERMFPRLKNCLEEVDVHLGFNIEIKYCMLLKCGKFEDGLMDFLDRNDYVDVILEEILHCCDNQRRIILSSFDPDVCIMLRRKQNRFPVLFLTQGDTKKYPQYMDCRTWNVEMALRFALSESLHGVCVHTEQLLVDLSLIERGRQKGLWMYCWGEENNNVENIKALKEKGINGIIVDFVDQFIFQ